MLALKQKAIMRLRANLDDQGRAIIKPILDAHKLEMKQTKDLIVIFRPIAFSISELQNKDTFSV